MKPEQNRITESIMKISKRLCPVVGGLLLSMSLAVAEDRPNVLIMLVDDVGGYNDLQSYGNTHARTPYLDNLRSQSLRLTNFHAAPMCTPTRAALLTGRDCIDSQACMVTCGRSIPRPDFPMIQEVFKADGYATGMFGKWHLGENAPFRPGDRGFEESLYFPGSSLGTARDFWNNTGWDATVLHNNIRTKYPGFITDVWNDEAMKWIRKQKEAKRPFFCYLPSNLIHGPEFVEESYKEPYRGRGEAESVARIYGALERYDGICARVDGFLEKEGLKENTIVIYFVDNGLCDVTARLYNAGLRGWKKSYYEGGHRVPIFVRWPKRGWVGGKDLKGLTEVQDLFPTLMEACKVSKPNSLKLSGKSLVPLLDGKAMPELDDRICFVQFGDYDLKAKPGSIVNEGHACGPRFGNAAVLSGEWRLVNDSELYDLNTDYSQTRNVIASHPEIANKLKQAYRVWWDRLQPDKREMVAIPIGLNTEPVLLDVSCWDGAWIDFSNSIRQGQRINGPLHIESVRDGQYRFDMRRWPQELGLPMTAAAPAGEWPYQPGKALPIKKVRIEIQGKSETREVLSGDSVVSITIPLTRGRTLLKTAFLDGADKVISGVYYVDASIIGIPSNEKLGSSNDNKTHSPIQ